MVSVQERPRYWRRLNYVLRHVRRTKIGTAMLGLELSLHINALLEEYALKQRVLVSQHQTLVRGGTMGGIEIGQGLLLNTDGLLKLLDVLGAPFSESCLSLAVPLLPLLCGRINLETRQHSVTNKAPYTTNSVDVPRNWPCEESSNRTSKARMYSRTGLRPPFRLGAWPSGVGRAWPCSPESAGSPSPSPSGLEPNGDSSLSCLIGSFLLLSSEGLSVAIPLTGSGDDCREGAANASSPHEGDRVHRRA